MKLNRRSLLVAPLALGLCGWSEQPMPQKWNGGHPESLDPFWNMLTAATVKTDRATGLMTASFPADLRKLAGSTVTIEGFILPLGVGRASFHFALTRRNSGCPFCPPSEPTEAVEVILTRPVAMSSELTTVSGQFVLQSSSAQGMFFQLRRASVV